MADWVIGIVRSLGYAGVALLAFLENLFPPIPSELIMPLAGYLVASGEMTLVGAIAAGTVGTLAGALAWYYIGVRIGEKRLRRWVNRHGHWLTLSNEDIDTAHGHIVRHGSAVVFFGRLIPGIRTWVSVPAGLLRMPFGKFLFYSAVGSLAWTSLLTFSGKVVGDRFPQIGEYVGTVSLIVFVLVGVAYAWRVIGQLRNKDRQPSGSVH